MTTDRPDPASAADGVGPAPPVAELGYEECRDELVSVVQTLERGGLDLDASLRLWERGEALARRCEEHLAGARRRIDEALGIDEDDEAGDAAGDDGASPPANNG